MLLIKHPIRYRTEEVCVDCQVKCLTNHISNTTNGDFANILVVELFLESFLGRSPEINTKKQCISLRP